MRDNNVEKKRGIIKLDIKDINNHLSFLND
jgi:hypothetical protein